VAGTDHWWDDLTRDRFSAVLELVLDAISDDYENLEIILRTINRWNRDVPGLKGWKALAAIPVSPPEVIKALQELTQEGFAQACDYDVETKQFLPVNFSQSRASVLWYYVTEKGMSAVNRFLKRGSETS
jgi:hypothetical protein